MIIGIYGYISTGKTSACRYLQKKYNFIYLNTDKIIKKIMNNLNIISFLEQTFPGIVINGVINRNNLRSIIFTNSIANNKLNNYLWPKINKLIIKIINNDINKNFLIEAIGLNSFNFSFTAKLFFTSSKKNIINRTNIRYKKSSNQIKKLLKIQKKIIKQIKLDYKIINNKSLLKMYQKIDKIIKKILGDYK